MSLLSDQLAAAGFEVRIADEIRQKTNSGKVRTMSSIGSNVPVHIQPEDGDITLGTISGETHLMIFERSPLDTDLERDAQIVFGTDVYDIIAFEEYPAVQMLPRHYQLTARKTLKN